MQTAANLYLGTVVRNAALGVFSLALMLKAEPSVAVESVDLRSMEQVVWAPDGKRVVARNRRELEIWNLEKEAIERKFVGHSLDVTDFVLTPDGASLVSVARREKYAHRAPKPGEPSDGSIRIWDFATAQERRRFDYRPHVAVEDHVSELVMHPQGDRFAMATWNSVIQWGMDGTLHFRHETPDQPGNRCKYSPDGKTLLVRARHEVRLLDARTGETVLTLRDRSPSWHGGGRFVCNGKYVAGGTVDGKFSLPFLVVWDAKTGEIVRRFEKMGERGFYDSLGAGGDRIANRAGISGAGIRVWNLGTMTADETIPLERVSDFAMSSDGTRMLVQTYPMDNAEGDLACYFITLWNLDTGREMLRLPSRRHPDDDMWASFSPDGTKVLISHGPIELLDAKTGASLQVFGQNRANGVSGPR